MTDAALPPPESLPEPQPERAKGAPIRAIALALLLASAMMTAAVVGIVKFQDAAAKCRAGREPAHQFQRDTLDGHSFALADTRGDPALLVFWQHT